MKISLIAAAGKNRELGLGNKLPWHLPDDLERFRALTRGHAVIMGRKTYESIGRPLPDRVNIIITKNPAYGAPGCIMAHSMDEALKAAGAEAGAVRDDKDNGEIFIIGGAEIYKLGLPYADKIYLTFVDAEVPADAFFPEFDDGEWRVTAAEPHAADERHPYACVFKVYERVKP